MSIKTENAFKPRRESKKNLKEEPQKESGFCVYMGPTVKGFVAKGDIFTSEAMKELELRAAGRESILALLLKLKPLIITDRDLAAALIELKKQGSYLQRRYVELELRI